MEFEVTDFILAYEGAVGLLDPFTPSPASLHFFWTLVVADIQEMCSDGAESIETGGGGGGGVGGAGKGLETMMFWNFGGAFDCWWNSANVMSGPRHPSRISLYSTAKTRTVSKRYFQFSHMTVQLISKVRNQPRLSRRPYTPHVDLNVKVHWLVSPTEMKVTQCLGFNNSNLDWEWRHPQRFRIFSAHNAIAILYRKIIEKMRKCLFNLDVVWENGGQDFKIFLLHN
ncbi:hypothetical protein C8R45DRAFT_937240 [Mycena sanguinolenta]|nr:hypothetical protein C8R45DRAFT_937240 [Mycena sanguinolenta]